MTIVERLQRAIDDEPFMLGGEHDLLRDALAEVERLRETNERLREAAEDALWFIGTEYDRVGLHKAGKSWRSTKDGAAYKLRAALKEDGR
jgi:hypothetical protein